MCSYRDNTKSADVLDQLHQLGWSCSQSGW